MSRYRWTVLAVATLMQVGNSFPQVTPAALGPIITAALHLTRSELGLLTDAIWGGMLLGLLPSGILVDRYGERRMIAIGGVALAAFVVLASLATAFLPLFLLLIPAAIAAASAGPGGVRALAAWFHPRQLGMAMGIRQTGVMVAGVVAALLLPPIALAWGWRAAFWAVAVAVLVATAAFVLFYREPAVQRRQGSHLSLRALARNRTFLTATGFGWIFMGAQGCSVTYLAISLHESAALPVLTAGYLLALQQVGGVAGRVGWGIMSDRLHSRGRVMAICGGLAVVACASLALLVHAGAPLLVLAAASALIGLTCSGWNALYITLSSEQLPERAATAVGAGSTVTFTGMLLATPAFGLIADHAGYQVAWMALAAWCAIGTAVAFGVHDRALAPRGTPVAAAA
ncbi:MAG TPA: MFS transporter [Candidatus Dormibacteraeota bacterium]